MAGSTALPDVSRFASLGTVERKRLLARAAKAGAANLTLGDFTGTQDASSVFVVDIEDKFDVSSQHGALQYAALSLGLTLFDPTLTFNTDSGDPVESYEVWAAPSEDSTILTEPLLLGSGDTAEHAQNAALSMLEMLVGSYVLPLEEWFSLKGEEILKTRRQRTPPPPPVKGIAYTGILRAKWVAPSLYAWALEVPKDVEQGLRDELLPRLEIAGSLESLRRTKRSAPEFQILVVEVEGQCFANFHDLCNAAHEGVLVPNLLPWPNFAANRHVVYREYIRSMRRRGWRFPWRNEEPSRTFKLHGLTWVKDTPLER